MSRDAIDRGDLVECRKIAEVLGRKGQLMTASTRSSGRKTTMHGRDAEAPWASTPARRSGLR
jgi:hypothetical protein